MKPRELSDLQDGVQSESGKTKLGLRSANSVSHSPPMTITLPFRQMNKWTNTNRTSTMHQALSQEFSHSILIHLVSSWFYRGGQ